MGTAQSQAPDARAAQHGTSGTGEVGAISASKHSLVDFGRSTTNKSTGCISEKQVKQKASLLKLSRVPPPTTSQPSSVSTFLIQ